MIRKYLPEAVFAIGISLFLCYAVSCDGPPSTSTLVTGARLQLDANLKFAQASKRKHGVYPQQIPVTTDPWNTPYTYSLPNGAPRVCSLGPDTQPNTADDICLP